MTSTFASIFCGSSALRSMDERGSISFFCRSRRSNPNYYTLSEHPLLEYQPPNLDYHPQPTCDVNTPSPISSMKPNRQQSPTPSDDVPSVPSYLISRDVALAWIDMGTTDVNSSSPSVHELAPVRSMTKPIKSVVRPLRTSTRVNRMTFPTDDGSSALNSTSVHTHSSTALALQKKKSIEDPVPDLHGQAVDYVPPLDGHVLCIQAVKVNLLHGTSIPSTSSMPMHSTSTGATGGSTKEMRTSTASRASRASNAKGILTTHRTTNKVKGTNSQQRLLTLARARRLIQKPTTTGSIPSPPPVVSFQRRFRTCFGVMSDWQSTVDPKTGRTYYFNAQTRETQWRKPVELASDEERQEMEEKERKQREFFSSMEANIIKSIASGNVVAATTPTAVERKASLKPTRGRVVRTISSMDEGTLKAMIKRTPSTRNLTRQSAVNDFKISELDRIEEMADMEQSSVDFGNSSLSMFGESSANLGGSMSEIMALRQLARISQEMAVVSENVDDDELDYSMSEGMDESMQTFALNLSDSLDISSQDFMLPEKVAARRTRDASFLDSLIFSPDVVDKKTIADKLEPGETAYSSNASQPAGAEEDDMENELDLRGSLHSKPPPVKPTGVYEMEEELDLRGSLLSKPPSFKAADVGTTEEESKPPSKLSSKPPLVKRNTCGTLYVESTMSAPDKDATIKCVCGVFRAHILGAEQEDMDNGVVYEFTRDKFRLFNDRDAERSVITPVEEEMTMEELHPSSTEEGIPNLTDITSFYRNVFTRAQMETDCIIMSLIYVERLIKVTDGALRPRRSNWRSLLFSCMILSSKVWDDLSMWNSDFSNICPAGVHLSVQRINELELAILKALGYKVKVQASEYAKYYFLLRSMLIKSGLCGEEMQKMNRLDIEDAKRLEQLSTSFENLAASKRRSRLQDSMRSKSMGDAEKQKLRGGKMGASLEHMMNM